MTGEAREALILLAAIYMGALAFMLRAGVVGVFGGLIRRIECPSGYWIVVSTQTVTCLAILLLGLVP